MEQLALRKNGIWTTPTRSQFGAIKSSEKLGELLQTDLPIIADMYRAGMTYLQISESLKIAERYNVSRDSAHCAVGRAIIGNKYERNPYPGLISNEEIESLNRNSGRIDSSDTYWNFNLVNARIDSKLTLEQLGEKVGVGIPLVVAYERLRAFPQEDVQNRISEVLEKDKQELFPNYLRKITSEINGERRRLKRQNYFENIDSHKDLIANGDVPGDSLDRILLSEKIEGLLFTLKHRERMILKLRFGFFDGRIYELAEIAEQFGISRSRVGQIEEKAMRKLSRPVKAGWLHGFLDDEFDWSCVGQSYRY